MSNKIILVLVLFALLFNCTKTQSTDDGILNIVTTIGMIADVAENIGGDLVKVTALMGPGVDPHLYKASAGDVQRLSKAELILFGGLHLESKMGEILEQMNGKIKTKAVSEVIEKDRLLSVSDYASAHDPHIWFDVMLWKEATKAIKEAIIMVDPENKEVYETNYQKYAKELDDLDKYVRETLKPIPESKRVLITAHDAFGYFGKAYDFEVKGLQGISTVVETGTADVQDLAQFIVDRKIPALFIESSVPRRNVEALQAAVRSRGFNVEIGGELFSDAMGNEGTEEGTYIGMVKHNVNTIASAFK